MKNIHLLTNISDETINEIINDDRLTPTARFILVEMLQYEDEQPFDETTIKRKYEAFENFDLLEAFELLVQLHYLKRIISDNNIHFCVSPDADENDFLKYN